MSEQADTLLPLIKPFGLSTDESKVYLYVLAHGFSSALVLSRQLSIARTKVYRLIDKLKTKGLIEQKLDDRGMRFGAADPAIFQEMTQAQEKISQAMRQHVPELTQHLRALAHSRSLDSKVLYYEGIEGLKQVSYNITKAKEVLRVFEVSRMSHFLPPEFAEDIRRKLVEQKITTLDLTNHPKLPGYTDVAQMIAQYSRYRYIDPEKLAIEFEVLIYNDVYATYTYQNDTIFAVEIYDPALAAMQKQLFDFVWQHAQPMRFTDARGAVELA